MNPWLANAWTSTDARSPSDPTSTAAAGDATSNSPSTKSDGRRGESMGMIQPNSKRPAWNSEMENDVVAEARGSRPDVSTRRVEHLAYLPTERLWGDRL